MGPGRFSLFHPPTVPFPAQFLSHGDLEASPFPLTLQLPPSPLLSFFCIFAILSPPRPGRLIGSEFILISLRSPSGSQIPSPSPILGPPLFNLPSGTYSLSSVGFPSHRPGNKRPIPNFFATFPSGGLAKQNSPVASWETLVSTIST